MNKIPNITPEAATERPVDAGSTSGNRLINDQEIILRRAQGELLKPLSEAAGIGVPTLSEWLKRPNIAKRLADAKLDIKVTKQLADRERREQERKAKAAKRREAKAAKPPEPEPDFNAAVETWDQYVDRMARAGRQGKLLRGIEIRW
jgi:hypothetical protein